MIASSRSLLAVCLVAASTGVLALAGCASQDPVAERPSVQTDPVTVGVNYDLAEQMVLGEVYAQGFGRVGREGSVVGLVDSNARVQAVADGEVTMSFGCTGELLGLLDPATARSLADEYRNDTAEDKATNAQWKDRVYNAFSKALPGDVMATDPGETVGCDWLGDTEQERAVSANPGAVLPQFVVPFYRKPALVRQERVEVLNRVAGSLNTKDLSAMVERVREGEDSSTVAEQWVSGSEFAG